MVRKTLKLWEDEVRSLRDRMPHVCGNCQHEGPDGVCLKHDSTPPDDFAETPSACPDWVDVVPF
jgi:hypothetical protein